MIDIKGRFFMVRKNKKERLSSRESRRLYWRWTKRKKKMEDK